MTAVATPRAIPALRAYRLVCRWQLIQLKAMLPFIVFGQLLFATGAAIGFGFLLPGIDPASAGYLATGSFLLNLLMVGLVIVPGAASEAKTTGAFDYMWALPVPRFTYLLADVTIWTFAALPGLVASLLVTSLRYDFRLDVSPLIVPAVLLSLLSAASLGYAFALRSPSAQVTNMFTNIMLVGIFLFSPLNFPADRLPGWLQAAHEVLPFASMAELARASLLAGPAPDPTRAFAVVGAWCTLGVAATVRSVARRA